MRRVNWNLQAEGADSPLQPQTGQSASEPAAVRYWRTPRKTAKPRVEPEVVEAEVVEISLPEPEPEPVPLAPAELDRVRFWRTPRHLMQQVWGWSEASGTRTLDSHIKALRAKVGAAWIRTVHGVGYRFEAPEKTEDSSDKS